MSDFDPVTQRSLKQGKIHNKKQLALKALNSYLEQLKIHYDLTEGDLIKILKIVLKIKDKESLGDIFRKLFK
ncbi:MAG: hypothetical protein ACOCWG_02730 [bacterium]